jgi:hypothetical protein
LARLGWAGLEQGWSGLTFAQRMMQRKQTIASWLTFWDVLGRFGTFWGRLGRKPIHCITIFKQVSTCSKDDVIIPRGNGLGWP